MFEVESDWSEMDQIFSVELDEVYVQLIAQNDENSSDRQVNPQHIIDQLKKEQLTAKEIMKQFGTIGAVLFYRSTREWATLFDNELFKKLDEGIDHNVHRPSLLDTHLKNKVTYFVPRLCRVVNECFKVLNNNNNNKNSDLSNKNI